jgi:uncharacterized protein (TIGR03086 family)
MDLNDLHSRTVANWQRTLDGVRPDQWDGPTPCTDWNVRALVNHVVGEELWTQPLLEGKTIAEVGDQFDGDVLGEDPAAKGRVTSAEAAAAAEKHLPAGGMVNVSWGQIPAEEYVRQLAADHLIHAWDLAKATGQDTKMEPDLVDDVAAWFAPNEDMVRAAGVIAAHQDLSGDPQTDLLSGYGRRADWTA